MTPSVVVFGNANVDLTTYVEAMPGDGETVIGVDFAIGMGGKGSNQAVACSRAGVSTAFVGSIGTDTFGDFAWDTLTAEHLDLSLLTRTDGTTGVATITVDRAGANRIAVFLGASGTLSESTVDDIFSSFSDVHYFVSQMEIPLPIVSTALRRAKAEGVQTVLNIAPYQALSKEILQHTDWLIGNEVETESLLGDFGVEVDWSAPIPALLDQLPRWSSLLGAHLVITLGERGALGYRQGETPVFTPAPQVSAVDTVGAGDCFVGYLVGFLDSDHSWQESLAAAVHAASHSVQSRGAQQSYPSKEALESIRQAATKATG